jgi:hypothetical protein
MTALSSSPIEACGCCDGVQAATPGIVSNRPALSAIGYRIGTWADFRESLVAGLSSDARPALAKLLTRDGDDFTLGLIDAFACAADVLTFYQERTANENYLRTALDRASLQELGRLIGYQPRPGVAAETWLAFTVETAPVAPAALPPEPGAFVTGVPALISLPVGLKVQSVPGPDEKPQTFETVEALADARAAWNALRPWLALPVLPKAGDTTVYLVGVRTGLKAGDAVVLAHESFLANPAGGSEGWDFRILSAVVPDLANDRTRIEFVRPLASINPPGTILSKPRLFALRRRASVFGHNAPMWASMPAIFKEEYPGGEDGDGFTDDWPAFTASTRGSSGSSAWIDLDAVVADFAAGGWAVVAKGDFNHPDIGGPDTAIELYAVRATSEVSRAAFALSGKVSRLELTGENFSSSFFNVPREVAVFGASEELALAEVPVADAVSGVTLPLAVAADGLLPGRRLIVRGSATTGGTAIVHLTTIRNITAQGTRCTVELDAALPAALLRDSVVVHANVALASHGETATQILGSGSAAQPFAQFELRQLPLTWRAAATDTGVAPEITLRVGDIEWTPRATLYGAAPAERAYTLDTDAAGRLWARFGDGVMGARLPTGQNNVRATYRKGLGAAGNVEADSLTQLASRPLGLKGVANPAPATGGTDAEGASALRQAMPLATRTLGRVVSLLDYEDFARAFAGIAKAQAEWLALRGGRTVVITVAAEAGAALGPTSPVWIALQDALLAAGDPLVRVRLVTAQLSTFQVGLKLLTDGAYDRAEVEAAVETALRAAFAFDTRSLAQPVQQSEVIAVVQAVPGVVALDLDWLYGGTQPATQTTASLKTRLLASRARVTPTAGLLGAELLTLAPTPLVSLGVMS